MTDKTILETVQEHKNHLFELAKTLDSLNDIKVVMTGLRGVDVSRVSGVYDPVGAAVGFITRVISQEKAYQILHNIQLTVKTELFSILKEHGYTPEDVKIGSSNNHFFLNPLFKVCYQEQPIIQFTMSSTRYTSFVENREKYWTNDYTNVNRSIEIEKSKDTKNKEKKLKVLYERKEQLEQENKLWNSTKEDAVNIKNIVVQFLESYGYKNVY